MEELVKKILIDLEALPYDLHYLLRHSDGKYIKEILIKHISVALVEDQDFKLKGKM